jgi:hypothetical protein
MSHRKHNNHPHSSDKSTSSEEEEDDAEPFEHSQNATASNNNNNNQSVLRNGANPSVVKRPDTSLSAGAPVHLPPKQNEGDVQSAFERTRPSVDGHTPAGKFNVNIVRQGSNKRVQGASLKGLGNSDLPDASADWKVKKAGVGKRAKNRMTKGMMPNNLSLLSAARVQEHRLSQPYKLGEPEGPAE